MEVALSASGGGRESPALAPLSQRSRPLLPDVGRGAEPGGLPAQPGQHGPPLALHAHQLWVAQHPPHQLLVPPDARGRILRKEGRTRISPGASPGISGAAPRGMSKGDSPAAGSSWSASDCTEFRGTGLKCHCVLDYRRALSKALRPACYLRPRQRVGASQLLDAALQQLRCPPEAGCKGMQFLRVGHTAGQWGRGGWASSGAGGQPAHEEQEEEEEEQCQARAGNTVGHQVKAKEEGSVEVDGQSRAGQSEAGRRGLPSCARGSPSPSPLLGFPVTFPGMSVRHGAAVGTEGHRGEVRRWLTA